MEFREAVQRLAVMDCICALAVLAKNPTYTRPVFTEKQQVILWPEGGEVMGRERGEGESFKIYSNFMFFYLPVDNRRWETPSGGDRDGRELRAELDLHVGCWREVHDYHWS